VLLLLLPLLLPVPLATNKSSLLGPMLVCC
jgi:hypothetical protein